MNLSAPYEFVEKVQSAKEAKILDVLRRVIANPGNAEEVAKQLCIDWFPLTRVLADGSIEFVIGDGLKR